MSRQKDKLEVRAALCADDAVHQPVAGLSPCPQGDGANTNKREKEKVPLRTHHTLLTGLVLRTVVMMMEMMEMLIITLRLSVNEAPQYFSAPGEKKH